MPKPSLILFFLILIVLQVGCNPREKAAKPEPDPVELGESTPKVSSHPSFIPSPALAAFLPKFDELSAKGFVPTLRRGSTGIGYTLETMLDIPENNSPGGDFMGMELKAWRDDGEASEFSEKMNLFLKEPKWIDGLKSADRVRRYGYVDPNGRQALYSAVTIETNSHQLGLEVDEKGSRVWLNFQGERIGFWDYAILAKRLKEKHSETAFVSAHVRGEGSKEEFHYFGVTWCREPSVEEFVSLLCEGDVILELRMHLKESGAARNHGSCFRIHKHRLKDLFKFSDCVRPNPSSIAAEKIAK